MPPFVNWMPVPQPGPWNVIMLFTVIRSIVGVCASAAKPPRPRAGGAGRRNREASMGLESLEQRMALTVAAPSIRLAAASDTGIRGDGITRLARPVFTGAAPARSSVVVYADGQLLGATRATPQGAWSLATPVARQLASGAHTMTAYAVRPGQAWSTGTSLSMAVDSSPPTASLAYDPTFKATPTAPVTGRVTVTFSEPVQGVSLANLRFTDPASGFTAPLNSQLLRNYVGTITTTQLSDRSYAFTPAVQAFAPGTYTMSFLRTGVADRAGNPLAAGTLTTFTIAYPV